MSTWYLELNDFDKQCARWYSKSIHEFAVSNGLNDHKVDDSKNGLEVHDEGSAAEWAFAKMFNIYPNTQLDGPNYIDFTLPNGMTVDVKSTDHFSGNLLVPSHFNASNSAEAFVLMRGTIDKGFEYVGWITSQGFYAKAEMKSMKTGYPETWCLSAGFLNHEPIYKPE